VYRTLNTNKVKYKKFLHEVGRSWISEVQNQSESSFDDLHLPQKEPKQDLPGRLSSDFRIHKLKNIVGGVEGKKKYPLTFNVLAFKRLQPPAGRSFSGI